MKQIFSLLLLTYVVTMPVLAQCYTETFDSNSLGWTEGHFGSEVGSSVIDKGVMTIKSPEIEHDVSDTFIKIINGAEVKNIEELSFKTYCYAPLDVTKPFEITTNVTIDAVDDDCIYGLLFNYKDGGNFYCFNFNEKMINFTRFVDNRVVGNIMQGVKWLDKKWPDKKKIHQEWELVYDGEVLCFLIDGKGLLKVKYMPMEFSGTGFYSFGDQTLIVKDITFTQK